MAALNEAAEKAGVLILNEVGERLALWEKGGSCDSPERAKQIACLIQGEKDDEHSIFGTSGWSGSRCLVCC